MGGITLMLVFMGFVGIGEVGAIAVGVLLDNVSANAGVLSFFGVSALVVAAAWPLAVRVTEAN